MNPPRSALLHMKARVLFPKYLVRGCNQKVLALHSKVAMKGPGRGKKGIQHKQHRRFVPRHSKCLRQMKPSRSMDVNIHTHTHTHTRTHTPQFFRIIHRTLVIMDVCNKCCEIYTVPLAYGCR